MRIVFILRYVDVGKHKTKINIEIEFEIGLLKIESDKKILLFFLFYLLNNTF